ncbi:hypothetical protein L083_1894 [Actinoplanes sp. N902-109]|nr:hypothetical protein L083_1894 [Actinoplanes sp. N902-109]
MVASTPTTTEQRTATTAGATEQPTSWLPAAISAGAVEARGLRSINLVVAADPAFPQ